MEPRAPERQWSPFTGEQERIEADSDYYDEPASRGARLDRRATVELKRGRPGLVALIAVIVEVIAIGGADNQSVIKHLTRYAAQHPFAFPGHLVQALTVYQWRLSPQPGDRANEPLAHAALVGTVLVLTALLVYVLCRGAVTFWRAFFGTWLAVVLATLAGMVVRNVISPPRYPSNFDNTTGAIFLGPNGYGVMAGVVLGFVCAVFAAIVAVATRRRVPVEGLAAEPSRPEPAPYVPQPRERGPEPYREDPYDAETAPYYGQRYGSRQYGGNGSGAPTTAYAPTPYAAAPTVAAAEATARSPHDDAASATTQLPAIPPEERVSPSGTDDAAATTQLPTMREEHPPAAQSDAAAHDAPTEAFARPAGESFPRPPDDEDLGQHPDHHDLA